MLSIISTLWLTTVRLRRRRPWSGAARQGWAGCGEVWPGMAWRDKARVAERKFQLFGTARHGRVRPGSARCGAARVAEPHLYFESWRGSVGLGTVRCGKSCRAARRREACGGSSPLAPTTGRGSVRYGRARSGQARSGRVRHGAQSATRRNGTQWFDSTGVGYVVRFGLARRGQVRSGMAGFGMVWRGQQSCTSIYRVWLGLAGCGWARCGMAWHGLARQGTLSVAQEEYDER